MKLLLLLVLSTCLTFNGSSQQYMISGKITGFPEGAKFFIVNLDTDEVLDSTVIRQNAFIMKGSLIGAPQAIRLYCINNNNLYYTPLLIGNDTISVKGDLKDFPWDLTITGSPTQDGLNLLYALTKEGQKQRSQLVEEYFKLPADSAKTRGYIIWATIAKLDSVDHMITKAFIRDHRNTYAALQYMFFFRNIIGRDTLSSLYASLPPYMQQNEMGLRVANYLKIGDPVKQGDPMVDFSAFDKGGKVHRPSEYKGKYILLDFSSTYCGPCMESVTDMKKLSAAYSNRLAIVSLSADAGKKTWLTGLERDQPSWLSLWDGKGIYSEAMLKYGVSGYPTFCLIDPKGIIVSLWTGYGKNDDGTGSLEEIVTKSIGK